jgi:D-3-phosphoglycerate dehydrogenase
MVVVNENVPNMVGQVSTALAAASLNIANLLNKSRGDVAYALIDLDGDIPEAMLTTLRAIPGVLSVRRIGAPRQ